MKDYLIAAFNAHATALRSLSQHGDAISRFRRRIRGLLQNSRTKKILSKKHSTPKNTNLNQLYAFKIITIVQNFTPFLAPCTFGTCISDDQFFYWHNCYILRNLLSSNTAHSFHIFASSFEESPLLRLTNVFRSTRAVLRANSFARLPYFERHFVAGVSKKIFTASSPWHWKHSQTPADSRNGRKDEFVSAKKWRWRRTGLASEDRTQTKCRWSRR